MEFPRAWTGEGQPRRWSPGPGPSLPRPARSCGGCGGPGLGRGEGRAGPSLPARGVPPGWWLRPDPDSALAHLGMGAWGEEGPWEPGAPACSSPVGAASSPREGGVSLPL